MADIFSTIINAITSAAKKNASQAGVPGQTADTSKSANAATPASALTPTSTGLYNPFPTGGPILAGGPGTAQALANQVSSIVATPGLDMAMPQGGAGQGASPIAPKAQQAIDPQLASSPQFSLPSTSQALGPTPQINMSPNPPTASGVDPNSIIQKILTATNPNSPLISNPNMTYATGS